ncbi:MAG TPA: protocatechuate 3,4-dioxygenase subunit beta [Burkholderiaceae bacterium]|jgi:protocatechuate 3,4-dioxygenase, beta subunit|nr:protocatechuate 3,4-dioxygenase subunit beta [Burkholderiaceae bacterium]
MSSSVFATPRDWTSHPPYLHPAYNSTVLRAPARPLVPIRRALSTLTAPVYGHDEIGEADHDLTRNARRNGEPLGERIVVTGRVVDERGRPIRNTLVEIWQANAAGRYIHKVDQHDAPIDPNFLGAGRCLTDADGRYRFLTVKPGAYPWGNHPNAWRPNHIHFSLFGDSLASRLVTQMYFPGDPLLAHDPIFQGTPEAARDRLISRFALDVTEPGFALGFVFDIVLRGPDETPMQG